MKPFLTFLVAFVLLIGVCHGQAGQGPYYTKNPYPAVPAYPAGPPSPAVPYSYEESLEKLEQDELRLERQERRLEEERRRLKAAERRLESDLIRESLEKPRFQVFF